MPFQVKTEQYCKAEITILTILQVQPIIGFVDTLKRIHEKLG